MDIVVKCHSIQDARERAAAHAMSSGGQLGPHNKVRVIPASFGAGPMDTHTRLPRVSLVMATSGGQGPHYRVDVSHAGYIYEFPVGTAGPTTGMERDEAEALAASGWLAADTSRGRR